MDPSMLTNWQGFWRKIYEWDEDFDNAIEDTDFDIIPKWIRYLFLLTVISTSSAGMIFVVFFDEGYQK